MVEKAQYILFNGEIIPYNEAKIHVMTPAVRYGSNVFEGIRAYWNEEEQELCLFRFREHMVRLRNSVKMMRMDTDLNLTDVEPVFRILRANQIREDCHLRYHVFVDGSGPAHLRSPIGWYIIAVPHGRLKDIDQGIRLGVSSWARTSDNAIPPRIKCVANYQNGRLAYLEATQNGYDSPLFLTADGKVSEGPGAAFFLIRNGVPITPSITCDILESITRDTLIQLFKERQGLHTQEREIDRTELYMADEAFLCGSGWEITPVVSIDGLPCGDGTVGPLTRTLQGIYFNVARGIDKSHPEWRIPVYKSI
jgi:branched-chain amino acid aminotransferase